jgi:hypothetical protein
MGATSAGLGPNVQEKPLAEVRNLASRLDLRGWELGLRLPHSTQSPLYPWTFLLDKWLNVSEGKAARHDHLDAARVDQDSRM